MKAKFIIFIISLFATLVTVEVLIRIILPQPNMFLRYYMMDGILWNKPNYNDIIASAIRPISITIDRYSHLIQPYQYSLRLNSEGQRNDRDFTFTKDASKVRILNLGDSIGFALPLQVANSYAKQLESLIPNVEVINASTPSCTTSRLLEYYQKRGYRWNSDIVIIQLTSSSLINADYIFLDHFGKDSYEIFYLNHLGHNEFVASHISKDEIGVKKLQIKQTEDKIFVHDVLNSFIDRKKYPFYDSLHISRLIFSLRAADYLDDDLLKPFMYSDTTFNASPEKLSSEYTKDYLDILQREVINGGSKLLVIIIPNSNGCSEETFQRWNSVLHYLKEQGIHYIDMRQSFCDLESFQPKDGIFLEGDCHPGEKGHRILSEIIAAYIKNKLL